MRFYLCHTPEGRKRLVTRQDEAKKLDKNAELIDLPVDQAGIKAGYEELFDRIFDLEGQIRSNEHDASIAPVTIETPAPAKPTARAPNPNDGADAIIDWMFDHATNSQVCDVFLGLSSRYSDLIKRERANAS